MPTQRITTIGVTGGIGTGKSVVCRMLSALDIPVYDTDTQAKLLYTTDAKLRMQMTALLGEEIYLADGMIDRARLANLIFSDSGLLEAINQLVHPAVRRSIEQWRTQLANTGYRLCAVESALLASSSALRGMSDHIVVVTAPREVCLERAVRRDATTRDAVLARMSRQISEDSMTAVANTIIVNDGVTPLVPQLESLLRSL